ncbi:MAG: hypothetical protein IPI64_00625 [Chloracidobacterium sp.]|nr:hypothetical protein [Chloracidobacterium sp.]
MPVSRSKRSKKVAATRRKKRLPEAKYPMYVELRANALNILRDDPHFLTSLKVGRAMNAVNFSRRVTHDYMGQTSSVAKRQLLRSTLVTGGYLYEGFLLLESLSLKYASKGSFSMCMELIGPSYKNDRKVLQLMRNNVAFHLDSDDKSTKEALTTIELGKYNYLSVESEKVDSIYFDFADELEWNFVFAKAAQPDHRPDDTVEHVISLIDSGADAFASACFYFLEGLRQMSGHPELFTIKYK